MGYSNTPDGRRSLLIKYDADGDTIFTRRYENYKPQVSDFTLGLSLVEIPEGGYFATFAGNDTLIINDREYVNDENLLLARLSETGEMIWRKAYETPLRYAGRSLLLTKDGKLLLGTGHLNTWAFVDRDYISQLWIMQTDTTGAVEWEYFSPEEELYFGAFGMVEAEDGGFVIATGKGTEVVSNHYLNDLRWDGCIVKLNALGAKEWETVFRGLQFPTYFQFLHSITAAPDGSGYLGVSGTFQSNPEGSGWYQYGRLCKASPEGDSL